MMRFEPKQAKTNTYQLYIYDDVKAQGRFDWSTWEYLESETSAEYFRKQLAEIPADAEIELFVNSNGGSVKEGTSIYNQLVRHPAHKTAYVDGFAYSVAFLILMACDHIVMGLGTSALAHNMWMCVAGNASELRKAADDLDKMMESNRKIFLKRCGKKMTEEELCALMEEERPLTPEECLEMGFCDEIAEQLEDDDKNPDDDEKEPDDDKKPDDDKDSDEGMANQLERMKYFLKQRQEMIEQMKQLDEVVQSFSEGNPEPIQEENKCIQFFEQFLGGKEE